MQLVWLLQPRMVEICPSVPVIINSLDKNIVVLFVHISTRNLVSVERGRRGRLTSRDLGLKSQEPTLVSVIRSSKFYELLSLLPLVKSIAPLLTTSPTPMPQRTWLDTLKFQPTSLLYHTNETNKAPCHTESEFDDIPSPVPISDCAATELLRHWKQTKKIILWRVLHPIPALAFGKESISKRSSISDCVA